MTSTSAGAGASTTSPASDILKQCGLYVCARNQAYPHTFEVNFSKRSSFALVDVEERNIHVTPLGFICTVLALKVDSSFKMTRNRQPPHKSRQIPQAQCEFKRTGSQFLDYFLQWRCVIYVSRGLPSIEEPSRCFVALPSEVQLQCAFFLFNNFKARRQTQCRFLFAPGPTKPVYRHDHLSLSSSRY